MSSTSLSPPPSIVSPWRVAVSPSRLSLPPAFGSTTTIASAPGKRRAANPLASSSTLLSPPSRGRGAKRVRQPTPIDEDHNDILLAHRGNRGYRASLLPPSLTAEAAPNLYLPIENDSTHATLTSEGERSVLFSEHPNAVQVGGAAEFFLDHRGRATIEDAFFPDDEQEGEGASDDVQEAEAVGDMALSRPNAFYSGLRLPIEELQDHNPSRAGEEETSTINSGWIQASNIASNSTGAGPSRQSRNHAGGEQVQNQMSRWLRNAARTFHTEITPNGLPRESEPQRECVVLDDNEQEENADGDDNDSYHSGDSGEFGEMGHRPILERTAIKHDIKDFTRGLEEQLGSRRRGWKYKVNDRLGEGTFSSVYLAEDRFHNRFDNEFWTDVPATECLHEEQGTRSDIRVALKKILATSSPQRIENELLILESLRGCRNVSQLITAFRQEDQVIIVLPYHRCDDFRHFYRHIDPSRTRLYMRALFRGLKDIHRRGIVHRDIKPANFLFDYETGDGVICDFGLAERYIPPRRATCQHAPGNLQSLQGTRTRTAETPVLEQAVYDARKRAKLGEGRVGFPHEDKRPTIKTNRAGTRGFRAPEVLLKCPDQTVAIDVWSAGVILLSILTHKFPVFNSSDDIEALMELAAVFGRSAIERCALLHNRTIISNVPSLDNYPAHLETLILKLNPHIYTPPMLQATSTEAKTHIQAVDDAIDLCSRLLRLDGTKRTTAAAALRHPFLRPMEGESMEDIDDEELLSGLDGKCGHLHGIEGEKHRASFSDTLQELAFGQGIPDCRENLCPEHEHWQQRTGYNPLVVCSRLKQDEEDEEAVLEVEEPDTNGTAVTRRGALVERDLNTSAVGGAKRTAAAKW